MEQVLSEIYRSIEMQLPYFVIAFIIVTLFFLIRSWIVRLILSIAIKLMIGINEHTKATIKDAFEKPLRIMVVIVGLYIAVLNLPYDLQTDSLMVRGLNGIYYYFCLWSILYGPSNYHSNV